MPSAKKAAPAKKPAAKAAAPASQRKPAAAAKAPSAKSTPAKSAPSTKEAKASEPKAAARKSPAPPSPPAAKAAAESKKAPAAPKAAPAGASKRPGADAAAAAAAKGPSPKAAPATKKVVEHDPKFLDEQRVALAEEREGYERQIVALKAEADQLAAEAEPGDVQFDDESGEGDTMSIERERDLALIANARRTIEDIDRALEKIDAGTYGICERCGQPILKARLKALPFATECVACKSGGLSARR